MSNLSTIKGMKRERKQKTKKQRNNVSTIHRPWKNKKVKKQWQELQKKFDVPVNAIGVKIKSKDQKTLKVWQEEGIDKFVKK